MGRSTDSDICKNVARIGEPAFFERLREEDTGWCERGWTLTSAAQEAGRRDRLFADQLTKDEHSVYLVNEDMDASGGATALAVFSNDRAAVEAFLADWRDEILADGGDEPEIDASDSVSQTL